jgi:hypothetical protein
VAAGGWQEPVHRDEPTWPVGFRVVQKEELPRGNWIERWPYECVYTISSTTEGLEVSFSNSDGYVHPRVRIFLTPTGARAQASYGDCTSLWHGDNLAGTTCLVSNGKDATLQFELYEGGSEWVGNHLRGQAQLGAAGVELAQRWSAPVSDTQRHERFAYSCPGGLFSAASTRSEFEVAGTIDALGRRQGLWVVRKAGSEKPMLEAMWRDGLPHGVFRENENTTTLLVVGQFHEGFEEGQRMIWYPDGTRHVSEYRRGELQWIANYDASGRRLGSSDSLGGLNPVASAHWESISAFHTRR